VDLNRGQHSFKLNKGLVTPINLRSCFCDPQHVNGFRLVLKSDNAEISFISSPERPFDGVSLMPIKPVLSDAVHWEQSQPVTMVKHSREKPNVRSPRESHGKYASHLRTTAHGIQSQLKPSCETACSWYFAGMISGLWVTVRDQQNDNEFEINVSVCRTN
jgi:hypothetical protein